MKIAVMVEAFFDSDGHLQIEIEDDEKREVENALRAKYDKDPMALAKEHDELQMSNEDDVRFKEVFG